MHIRTSNLQDGDVDKYASPPHTTPEKITTRLQSKYDPTVRKLSSMEVRQQRICRSHIHPDG